LVLDRDEQLRRYIDTFWGYGNLDGPYWFVGMEQGGGGSWGEVGAHLDRWQHVGAPAIAPFRPPADELTDHRWFGPKPRIQPYWGKLIRLLLAAEDRPCSPEAVRNYQARHLATSTGETCLFELLPLPSPSTDRWIYAEHSRLPLLKDRGSYLQVLLPRRIVQLRSMISEKRPRFVVFAGLSYLDHWAQIVGTDLPIRPEQPVSLSHLGTTAVAIRHPSSVGVGNGYFEDVGRTLASRRSR
jgi:hypothetical protein